jgi:hypothetical protein
MKSEFNRGILQKDNIHVAQFVNGVSKAIVECIINFAAPWSFGREFSQKNAKIIVAVGSLNPQGAGSNQKNANHPVAMKDRSV